MRHSPIRSKVDPKRIILDEALGRHDYTMGGKPCVSVTTIIREEGLGGPDDRFSHNPDAALRGRAVHKAVALDVAGTLVEETVHSLVRPYLDQWRRWAEGSHIKVLASEAFVGYPAPAFCGRLDLILRIKGYDLPVLTDLKTGGGLPATVGLQTAAYALCLTRPVGRMALLLDGTDGPARPTFYEARSDAAVFLAAATVNAYKRSLFGQPKKEIS